MLSAMPLSTSGAEVESVCIVKTSNSEQDVQDIYLKNAKHKIKLSEVKILTALNALM